MFIRYTPDRLLNITQPPLNHASSSPISLIGIGSLGLLLATKLNPLWVVVASIGLKPSRRLRSTQAERAVSSDTGREIAD